MTAKKRKDIVQVKNPRTGHYVKIDRDGGLILAHKKTKGAYKGIPVARRKGNSVTAPKPAILGPSALAVDKIRGSRSVGDPTKLLAAIRRTRAKIKGIYLTDKDINAAKSAGRL